MHVRIRTKWWHFWFYREVGEYRIGPSYHKCLVVWLMWWVVIDKTLESGTFLNLEKVKRSESRLNKYFPDEPENNN